jgi:hypothetical protein
VVSGLDGVSITPLDYRLKRLARDDEPFGATALDADDRLRLSFSPSTRLIDTAT